jgi:hypothetical protein
VPCNITKIREDYGAGLASTFQLYKPELFYCPPSGFKVYLNGSKFESNSHVTISMYNPTATTTTPGAGGSPGAGAGTTSGGGSKLPTRPESVTIFGLIYNFNLDKKNATVKFLDRVAQFETDFSNRVGHFQAWMGTKTLDDSKVNVWPSSLAFASNTDLIYKVPFISSSSLDFSGLDSKEFGRVTLWMGYRNV